MRNAEALRTKNVVLLVSATKTIRFLCTLIEPTFLSKDKKGHKNLLSFRRNYSITYYLADCNIFFERRQYNW